MKQILFCFLLLFSVVGQAQNVVRAEIKGNILVPEGFDAEGITIFNKTANRGTVSSEKGNFLLEMAAGDTLIFAAIQFKELEVIVEQETIESGALYVEIFEGLNELPEIVIKPHNLTGSIATDVENIEVEKLDFAPFSFPNIKDLNFQPDSQTSPENAAMASQASPPASVDFIKVLGLLGSVLLPKKRSKPIEEPEIYVRVDRELRSRYSEDFFLTTFGVASEKINDFISFAESNGLSQDLLQEGRELDLLQFLVVQSGKFGGGK